MKCQILAVEDSATQAEALRALLEEQGHDVSVARSAELALELLATTEFDLVLSDVMMPGITGYELCHRIKRDSSLDKLPVVLLTSLTDPMDIVRGLECGADNYITKPYDPQHLLARVRHVLDNRRLRRDAKASLGVTLRFLGRDLTITSEREQILDLFISSVEDVVRTNEALQKSQRELAEAHAQLESYARGKDREARVSTDRYRALLQNAGDAIFVLDLKGHVLELNLRASELLGLPADEVLQQPLLDLVAYEDRHELEVGLASLGDVRPAWHAERKFLNAQGKELWCEITASHTPIDRETLVLLIVRDVTDRRNAEDALRHREAQLREAQQIANIGSFRRNLLTNEQTWSDQLCRIVGREPSEGVSFEEFLQQVHPDDRDVVTSATANAAKRGEPFFIEYRLRRPDGAERIVQGRGAVDTDSAGAPTHVTGTLQDVTELREAETALREREEADRANRAKSEFLSRMSHELRTPLNAILGFAQLLALDELEVEQRDSIEQILRGGHHLLQLINEVLDLARIEAGRLSLSLEPVSVGEVIRDAVDLLQPLANQRKITLATEMDFEADPFVLADVQRLKQVMLNLISNGIKYNQTGGVVTIQATGGEEGRLRLIVRDTGPGLSHEDVQKLFVPFQRLRAEESEIEGTGLGLMLAKGLVEAMSGYIGVESEIGTGSSFWVELERAEPVLPVPLELSDTVVHRPADIGAASVTRTVLYIEDNSSNLRLVERVLSRPGISLLTAMQGSLGLDLARHHRPDLVLLDLNLPDLSGEQVLQQLRDDPELSHIPVIILSADAMEGQADRLKQAGARDYITKPIDVQLLLKVVYQVLEEKRS